jgi:hypothetical protein
MVSYYEKHGLKELTIKNLQERSMEKRSQATKEVQDEIERYIMNNEMDAIKLRIDLYKKLTEEYSQAAYRRAGLFGLSAIGIALFQRHVSVYLWVNLEILFVCRERISSWTILSTLS